MKLFRYDGIKFKRFYVMAENLEDAMSKRFRRSLWQEPCKYDGAYYDCPLSDLRDAHKELFENWFIPESWDYTEDRCFLDDHY